METKVVISIIGDLIDTEGDRTHEKVLARDELDHFNPDVINDNIGELIEAALEAASKDGKHLGDYIDFQMTTVGHGWGRTRLTA